jgi:lysophospholipase L1-like esterase
MLAAGLFLNWKFNIPFGITDRVKYRSLSDPMRFTSVFIVLLFGSCLSNVSTPMPVLGETRMPASRFLALGDSYTIGESVAVQDRWPNQLADALAEEDISTDVTIIARTGWTVDELWEGIQKDPPEGTYDLVTLLIGVNDQYRGYPVDGYREDFRFMLGKGIEYAGGNPDKVIVLSIPDWGVTPFAGERNRGQIAGDIDAFNAVNRDESEKAKVHYVDVTPISREAMDDPSLIAADGLHPSGKMYAEWARLVLPVALEILR